MRKNEPIRLCLIGSEAAGKTCFLAGLLIAAERDRRSSFHSVTGRDSLTKQYFRDLAATLREQKWPAASTQIVPLDMDVRFNEDYLRLMVLDCSGEYLREVIATGRYVEDDELKTHLEKADFLLLVFDPDVDLRKASPLSAQEKQRRHERLNTLVDVVADIRRIQEVCDHKDVRVPKIGVMISKVDLYPELQTPDKAERFLKDQFGPLYERLAAWPRGISIFPVSAVGGTEHSETEDGVPVPGRNLEPFGYDGIISWILGVRQATRRRPFLRAFFVVVVALILGYSCFRAWERSVINWVGVPTTEINDIPQALYVKTPGIQRAIDTRVDTDIEDLEKQLSALQDSKALRITEIDELRKKIEDRLEKQQYTSRKMDIEILKKDTEKIQESCYFQAVQDRPSVSTTDEYLRKFPKGANAESVRNTKMTLAQNKKEKERQKVSGISPDEANFFASIARQMRAYLELYPDDKNHNEIKRAADLAQNLSTKKSYDIQIKNWGQFTKKYKTEVHIKSGSQDPIVFRSEESTTRSTKGGQPQLSWTMNEKVCIELYAKPTWRSMVKVAWVESSDSFGLKLLNGKRDLKNVDPNWRSYFQDGPYVTFGKLNLDDNVDSKDEEPDAWQLLEEWIYPGTKWKDSGE